ALEQFDRHPELRAVCGAGAPNFPIGWRRHAARLRPFLQQRLRIAQWARRLEHTLLPVTLDQRGRRRVTAVDENGADQRLANVGEDRRAAMAARLNLRI